MSISTISLVQANLLQIIEKMRADSSPTFSSVVDELTLTVRIRCESVTFVLSPRADSGFDVESRITEHHKPVPIELKDAWGSYDRVVCERCGKVIIIGQ